MYRKIGSRGIIISNKYGDNVYLINSSNRIFLCDSGEGNHIDTVKEFIFHNNLQDKELIIFNSHSDWDHIWGNYLLDSTIISHEKCRKRMEERALHDVDVLNNFHDGDIKIRLPEITFTDKMIFSNDDVEFIYMPGHTIGSSICYDKLDSVIYVADMIEEPIPLINNTDILEYIKSLEKIKKFDVNFVISSHSGLVDYDLIERNLNYLKSVYNDNKLINSDLTTESIHKVNKKNLLLLKCDEQVQNHYEDFDFRSYKKELWNFIKQKFSLDDKNYWDIRSIDYNDLKHCLVEFIMEIRK